MLVEIMAVHETLESIYDIVLRHTQTIKHFGFPMKKKAGIELCSVKLQPHDIEELQVFCSGSRSLTMESYECCYETRFNDPKAVVFGETEQLRIPELARTHGFLRTHALLKTARLTEIEYMFFVLERLVEQDWIPGVTSLASLSLDSDEGSSLESLNPTEPSQEVRIAVWLRDKGKCSECAAKENVELAFIIPPARGGAVNEHNVRLLCNKCRVKQGDRVN